MDKHNSTASWGTRRLDTAARCRVDHNAAELVEVRFFVTGPSVFAMTTMEGEASAAGGVFHAKALGTNITACGLTTGSWPKMWDVAFDPEQTVACRECVGAVEQLRAAAQEAAKAATKARRRSAPGQASPKTGRIR